MLRSSEWVQWVFLLLFFFFLIYIYFFQWVVRRLSKQFQILTLQGRCHASLLLNRGPTGINSWTTLFSMYINNLIPQFGRAEALVRKRHSSRHWTAWTLGSQLMLWYQVQRKPSNYWWVQLKSSIVQIDITDLYLSNTKLGEATHEKILGIKIDKHSKWDKHRLFDY